MRSVFGPIIKHLPFTNACANLAETSIKVCNCTSPSKALVIAVTDVAINCTPPGVKYPILCAALARYCAASVTTGSHPLALTATASVTELIVKSTFG